MSKGLKFFGVVLGVPILVLGLVYVNTAVYPFQSKRPNFADVEQAFAKLQFPAEWQEVSSTENRGVAGRQCDPFNSSGCFHKSKTFKFSPNATYEDVKSILTNAGCKSVSVAKNTRLGESKESYELRCRIGTQGVYLVGTFEGPEGESYISATTY
jgi:hypothetical protein